LFTSHSGIAIERPNQSELEEAIQATQDYETRVGLRTLIDHLRAEEAPREPLQIEIINADKIGKVDKIISVKRDDAGKMTGAVLQAVS